MALILALGTTTIAAARDGASWPACRHDQCRRPGRLKIIASLGRPDGDLTGTSAAGEEVLSKQVELLSAAVPEAQPVQRVDEQRQSWKRILL